MAIINISRQVGSMGDEIADKVAEQLGYRLFVFNFFCRTVHFFFPVFAIVINFIKHICEYVFYSVIKLIVNRSVFGLTCKYTCEIIFFNLLFNQIFSRCRFFR